jgi:predicted SprT family Zn-dependent metalloprotease
MRDSVDSVELNNLLNSLHIGKSAHKDSYRINSNKLEATTSESEDEDYCVEIETSVSNQALDFSTTPVNTKPSGRTLPVYEATQNPEIIDLVDDGTDVEDDEDNVFVMPTTARKTINLIDSSSSEEEDDDTAFKPSAPRYSRKIFNLIDSSSGSENEDEPSQRRPANQLPTSASLLLPSLNAILQRPGGSKEVLFSLTTTTNQSEYDYDLSDRNTLEEPRSLPPLPLALQITATMSHAAFAKKRTQLARDSYAKYNSLVFNNVLPPNLDISWNKRLATTAGLTHYKREVLSDPLMPSRYTARIELSCKVLDTPEKLERTMVHEMCHCAAWLVDHVAKPPHGAVFKRWADRAMRAAPHLDVSTCHAYDIFYAFQYQCSGCNQTYGRHSNSIDVSKKVCGVCRGKLIFLGKFERGGSPAKTRKPTAFNLFIKDNFSAAMKERGPGAVASEVMKDLTAKWKSAHRMSTTTSGGENMDSNNHGTNIIKNVESTADLLINLAI